MLGASTLLKLWIAFVTFVLSSNYLLYLRGHVPSVTLEKFSFLAPQEIPTVEVPEEFRDLENVLRQVDLRFYMYDDPRMIQAETAGWLRWRRGKRHARNLYQKDALMEIEMVETLGRHPLRVKDPEHADIFVVPICLGAQIIRDHDNSLQKAFDALISNPTFRTHQGHRHVIISLTRLPFNSDTLHETERFGLTGSLYAELENVTVAQEHNAFTKHLVEDDHSFKPLFDSQKPVTNSGFSLGLASGPRIPFSEASWGKFSSSRNFAFYHTDKKENLSLEFREAAMQGGVYASEDSSSIGYGIKGRSHWLDAYADSKFCLVVRGNTPHSRDLMRAVKSGCIPVVISDSYQNYAPTLGSTLNMGAYTIMYPEKSFLEDPERLFKRLRGFDHDVLRRKLHMLHFAQKVALHDHPDSLFVQAFLKEADSAMKNTLPKMNALHRDPPETQPAEYFKLDSLRIGQGTLGDNLERR